MIKTVIDEAKTISLADFDKAVSVALGNYFGQRDDETLGDAIERRAKEPHPMFVVAGLLDAEKAKRAP